MTGLKFYLTNILGRKFSMRTSSLKIWEEGIGLTVESPRGSMEINFDIKGSSLFTEKGGGMRGRVEGLGHVLGEREW